MPRMIQDFVKRISTRSASITPRFISRSWLIVLIPSCITLTAYGVAEFGPKEEITLNTQTELIATPPLSFAQSDSPIWHEDVIRAGDTLSAVLNRLNVDDKEASQFIKTDPVARSLYELHTGRSLRAKTERSGALLELNYLNNKSQEIKITRQKDGFKASIDEATTQQHTVVKSGTINSSFYASTDQLNIPDDVTRQLIDIFSGQIDFHRGLQKGDRFSVVYESFTHDGVEIKTGKILAAEFSDKNKTLQALWYTPPGSTEGAYYTPDGNSLKQSFLKNPVEFSRISSGFKLRFHPVLKSWRQHKGIDFAASTGTKIMSTADGVISKITQDNSGYGKHIEINHDGKYSTLYAHMSAFTPGLKQGSKIKQGEVIGLVGATGRVTGPHLHYEFKVNGQQVDPIALKLPTAKPIESRYLAHFQPIAAQTRNQLAFLQRIEQARAE
ncbi:peptidoglycan DD-metalloendopeptidase family protein [Iodobacter sp. HSC-16F04]|uniref:Peptidoglycan DD-metalloendopeptidase family protein n=1 Tax=Iodobacter violaceini TaxID=3044271 RepID=A0ABX0KZU3_9NEIS|nr:peptidoglycan DD-metalloendopeptidase family protein [Iodobacter violacea]NHQ87589.1 peptidoglycan DD-metalloendopeptidase family protein [Iodobacter violacea]